MEYRVHILQTEEELADCPEFRVDQFQWNCQRRPQTTGRLGYLPGKGFFLRMVCRESDPLRTYVNPQDPVCNDSAMEAFFTFAPQCAPDTGRPDNNCLYLNFELNANGAMLAKYGFGRKGRKTISEEAYRACGCRARIGPDSWAAELYLPQTLLSELYGIGPLAAGDRFYCNFYKISESKDIEHYASFSPIESATPNFHLPEFFAGAVIV